MKRWYQILICMLLSGNVFSQNFLAGANPFDSNNGIEAQETYLVYTQVELLAMGYNTGNTIDTLCFTFTSRHSTAPYTNFNVNYYYTNPFFAFSNVAIPPPAVTAVLNAYSGTLPVSSTIPPTGGVFVLPLTTPIVWNGSANNLVIVICWTLASGMPSDSVVAIQDTAGSRHTARWRGLNNSVQGCFLTQTSNVIRNTTEWRPDIFTCNTITSANHVAQQQFQFTIYSVSFQSNNLVKVNYSSPENNKCNFSVYDISGKLIFNLPAINLTKGESNFFVPLELNKGAYIVSLNMDNSSCSKLLIK